MVPAATQQSHAGGGGMSTKSLAGVTVLVIQLCVLLSGAHASDQELGQVSVRIIDQVGVSEKEWGLAQQVADRVFQSAGLSLNWIHCLWNPSTGNADCPQATTPNVLSLVMVSEQTANRMQTPARVFGIALTDPEGSFGSRGYIYYGRIQSKCFERHDINEALLLGTVVAHELGHLLLGPNSHSPKGIMKPDLERGDMTGIQLSGLQFNDRQSETLRDAVERRLQAAHTQAADTKLYIAQTSKR